MYTRKNAKLSHDMMVAILAPYIRAAMPSVSKVTISSDGLLILRQERRKWDRCVSLDVPLEVPVRSGRGKRYLNIVLRLLIRDDTNWLLDWECIEELPTGLEEKLEARVRAILRKSRNNAFRELLERWRWGGTLVGVKLSPEDFGMLVKVLAESYTYQIAKEFGAPFFRLLARECIDQRTRNECRRRTVPGFGMGLHVLRHDGGDLQRLNDYSNETVEGCVAAIGKPLGTRPGSQPLPDESPSRPFSCAVRKTCGQMQSCEEAQFYLRQCRAPIDGDGDGVPCEAICR